MKKYLLMVIVLVLAGFVGAEEKKSVAVGPVKVGDAVEISYGGKWWPGTVTFAEGLTYFVHWGEEKDNGKFDRFYHLFEMRAVGQEKTLAETYKEKTADPQGGPVMIGETIEAQSTLGWKVSRVARRVGEKYVVFPESEKDRLTGSEMWVGLDAMRPVGSKKAYAETAGGAAGKPRQPTKPEEIKVGDQVEAYKRGGYGWFTSTVMAMDKGRYFVQAGPDSAVKGWVTLVNMRAVGSKERFEAEDLKQFAGDWRLSGDAFFTTAKTVDRGDHIEKTMELNSGAGQDAGRVTINADGTYVLHKTVVYRDEVPGKWVRNPDQSEGGILLKDGESEGKDLLVSVHPGGRIYLQGSLRGPGKIGTK